MQRATGPSSSARPARASPASNGEGGLRDRFAWFWRIPRPVRFTLPAIPLLLLVAIFSIGPIVRSRVMAEGARRHLDVEVGSVRPGFFSATLKDIVVRPQGVAGVELHLKEARADLSIGLSLARLSVEGGDVRIDGEVDDVMERLRTFRKGGSGSEGGDASKRTPITVDGLSLSWKMPSGELGGSGIRISRENGVLRASCARCTAKHEELSVEIDGGEIELGPENVVKRVNATSVLVARDSPRAAAPAPAPTTSDLPPPPLPTVAKRGAKAPKGARTPAPEATAQVPRMLPSLDLHAWRNRIATLATAAQAHVPDGLEVSFGGLALRLSTGGDAVSFGPSPFSLARRGDLVHVSFASDKADGNGKSTPLAIDADIPLGAGDVVVRLSGGPVSLELLGVKEGMKGLFDVSKGTVTGKGQLVLAAAGDTLTFDGQIALSKISIDEKRLSPERLRNIDLAVSARGVMDDTGKLRVDDAELGVGAFHLKTHGTVEETSDHFAVSLGLDLAPAACQSLVESAPDGLLPTVRASHMAGTIGGNSRVVFDTRAIDKLVLEYVIDDKCKMTSVPEELSRDHFSSSFTYRTYHPDGTPSDTTTGPGTESWTNLDDISPFMVAAVLTTEDGAFYRHHGFNHSAIKNSVAANLKARRFVRGASTISMQLAKNLFLSREKTLSRKIEEVILTDYLEQVFRKDDVMELYLNVVEFGPDVYGITKAADYYFGRKPEELDLPECFFLASLLPSPSRYGKLRDKGEVPETWMRHLTALMEIAAKNGKITKAELAEGLTQTIAFHKPGDPPPAPRKPVRAIRRDPYEDDSDWRPLD